MFRKIQYWLIKFIVGKREVMMNCKTSGGVDTTSNNVIILGNTFTGPHTRGKETKIQMFKDKNRKWRFRLVSSNYKILCSSEAYSRKCYCLQTAVLIKNSKFAVIEK